MERECKKYAKYLYCLVSLIILFTAISCGARESPDSVSGTEKEPEILVDKEDSITFGEENDSSIAVAEFHYLEIPEQAWQIAMNDEWIYYAEMVEDETSKNEQYLWSIFRNKLSDTTQPETYLVSEKNTLCSWMNTMFLDKEGNCSVFWSENEEVGPGEGRGDLTGYYLEKYDENGMLIWHVDYALEEFNGAGESLNQGLVTEDGRIFLYQTGSGGEHLCACSGWESGRDDYAGIGGFGRGSGRKGQWGICLVYCRRHSETCGGDGRQEGI